MDALFSQPGFPGPLDLVPGSWGAAYSAARRLGRSYTGPIVKLRESGADAEEDIFALRSGDLDQGRVNNFIGANSGYFKTKYDQSGAALDAAQATAALQPLYVVDEANDRPSAFYDGLNDYMSNNAVGALFSGTDKPLTIIAAARRTELNDTRTLWSLGRSSSATPFFRQVTTTTPNWFIARRGNSNDTKSLTSGTPTTNVAVTSAVFTGTTLQFFADGVQVGSDTDLDVSDLTLDRFAMGAWLRSTLADYFTGHIYEMLISTVGMSQANRELVEANMTAYYKRSPQASLAVDLVWSAQVG